MEEAHTKGTKAAGVISTSVVTLMEGVLHAMFLTKLKVVATLLLLAVVGGGGAGLVTYQKLAAQPLTPQPANKSKAVAPEQQLDEILDKEAEKLGVPKAVVTPEDRVKAILDASNFSEKMKSLLKARLDAAATELRARHVEYCAGRGVLESLIASSRRLLDAERDLSAKKSDQIAAWEGHLQRMQQIYLTNLERFNTGRISTQDLKVAEYYRLDAEIGLERAKARVE